LADFLKQIARRVLVFDGAISTNIRMHKLTAEDYRGNAGCSDPLCLSEPEAIRSIRKK
jgi:5-methyltetrahydrofolate--homocysteine methyltransferase